MQTTVSQYAHSATPPSTPGRSARKPPGATRTPKRRICSLAAIPASHSRSGGGALSNVPAAKYGVEKTERVDRLWHNIFRATADLRGRNVRRHRSYERDGP